MSQDWYIEHGNDSRGPLPLEDVFELIERNEIAPEDWLESDGVRYDLETFLQQWPDPREPIDLAPVENQYDPTKSQQPIATTTPQTSLLSETAENFDSSESTERNCILILGRRRAGKTIYLATLYDMLWKSTGHLTMKAVAGPMHAMLSGITDQLRRGSWPEATLGARRLEFVLTDRGERRVIVACDYSGEVFHRAFVEEDNDSPEVKQLMNYLRRAAAVILLIDPAVAINGAHDEIVDDDFGMVQAVERIRKFSGGREVPITLALTKSDRNREVIRSAGKTNDFIHRHYPALVRTLGHFTVFMVSAVQEVHEQDRAARPDPESTPINVEKPLVHCLEQIRRMRAVRQENAVRKAAADAQLAEIAAEEKYLHQYNWKVAILVAFIVIVGLCVCALIWFLKGE